MLKCNVKFLQQSLECNKCDKKFESHMELKVHIQDIHEKKFICGICGDKFDISHQLNKHIENSHEKNFKCEKCNSVFGNNCLLKSHVKKIHEKKFAKPLRIASLNIGRGFFAKEELLIHTIKEHKIDICSVSECDVEDFNENKPFSIKGFKTLFPIQRPGNYTKRLLCFVSDKIEVHERKDLMSNLFSSIWFELKGKGQKILISVLYREFSDLSGLGQMSIDQQIERWKIYKSQIEQAKKENSLILCLGDMNINLEKLEESSYYLKKLAEEYQIMTSDFQLEVLNFGITWSRSHKNGITKNSAVDHAMTNKIESVHDYFKIFIDFSDHQMICVDLKTEVQKLQNNNTACRDFRKMRSNPQYFLNECAKVNWESLASMLDVDEMQSFFTSEINKCLDKTAPWKTRKMNQKKYSLPRELQAHIQKRKELQKRYQISVKNGEKDLDLLKELKKHSNFTNKMIKKAVRVNNGQNVSSVSTVKEIWNNINDILKPEKSARSSLKIETENKIIADPLELAETFNVFFKEKVEILAAKIKKNGNVDPLSKLRAKLQGSNLKFKLMTVKEKEVFKIMKSLKPKKSFGIDGITSEVLKLGAQILVVPLTYIINYSIVTGKFPTEWKTSKVIPLFKKGEKKLLKNYRPVALLSVAGMILERIVATQIEDFFEKNMLFGSFQYGFRRKKSTISELLTLFDTLLEAKNVKKEILMMLYDLSSAFDTVSHQILISKLQLYGFDKSAITWMKSYLNNRKQVVTVAGQISTSQEINIGTPQGSRLSPLLFVILTADMDLWTDQSILSNFADDTQSIVICNNKENLIETTLKETKSIIEYFGANNLVNNADKAAIIYNSKGKGSEIIFENIGEENIKSSNSEKLLGLHINSEFNWSNHIDNISIELNQRIGLLRRIKQRIPKNKLIIIAEAIFNSKLRYGIAVYLNPIFDKEDLKVNKLSENARKLQVLQNKMLRTILGININSHVNMQKLRNKIKMFSVNQMCIYHTFLEAFNVFRNKSSEQIQTKWEKTEKNYKFRNAKDLNVPDKPSEKCTGFSYTGAKLFNSLPSTIKDTEKIDTFKNLIKKWIWENIPSF